MDKVQHRPQGLQDGRPRLRDSEGRKPDDLRLLSRGRIRNAAATSEAEKDRDRVWIFESWRFQQEGQEEEKNSDLGVRDFALVDGIKQIGRRKNEMKKIKTFRFSDFF